MHPFNPRRLALPPIRTLGLIAILGVAALSACQSGSNDQGATPTKTPVASATLSSAGSCQPGAYCAHVPGPTCDLGGATWANLNPSNSTLTCGQDGMHYTESAVTRALVAFSPPSGAIADSFSASITIELTGGAHGCVGLVTLTATSGAGYSYLVCQSNTGAAAVIFVSTGTTGKPLAEQAISLNPQSSYTFLVSARGANKQLTINGVPVASGSDSTYTTTQLILLELLPTGSAPATAVFSDFRYTPLS